MIVPDDDEEYEVIQPRPPVPQERPKPLPRLWKHDQNPEDAPPPPPGTPPLATPGPRQGAVPPTNPARPATPPPAARAGNPAPPARAPRPAEPEKRPRPEPRNRDEAPKRVLIEDTPEFDTYDARQRVRTIITLVILAACAVGIAMLVLPQLNLGEESFENLPDEGVLAKKAEAKRPKPDQAEGEAQNMLTNAKRLAQNGKPKDAASLLNRLVAAYPSTKAAGTAREALGRPNQNPPLPLFLDDKSATVVATTPPAAAPGEAPPATVVEATAPSAPGAPGGGQAQLTLPKNPAEPPRQPVPTGTVVSSGPKTLPPGFSIREGGGLHPSGWPLQITSDRDGSPMIFISPGTFRMGRDDGSPDEGPTHLVNLSAYYIDEHEVTIRQYELYVKETGRRGSLPPRKPTGKANEEEYPIGGLSARDAVDFLEWTGKKLPTEAQWEKAARGPDGRMFPWGNAEPTWVKPRQSKQIDPIFTYELDRTPLGVYDLAGNAWEWTADYFDGAYYKRFRDTTAVNPVGPPPKGRGAQLVVKGGSKTFHVAWREGLPPETRYPFLGFRGVLAVDSPAETNEAPAVAAPGPAAAPTPAAKSAPSGPARKTTKSAPAGGIVPF